MIWRIRTVSMKMMSEWFVPIREGMVSSLPVDTSLYVQDFLNKCLLCKESIEARTIIKECRLCTDNPANVQWWPVRTAPLS